MKNNLLLKILSLLMAFLLWMYVVGKVDPVTMITISDIPVKLVSQTYLLEQRGLVIKEDKANIDIVVSGKRSALIKLQEKNIKAAADLRQCRAGENQVPVTIKLPKGINLPDHKKPELEIELVPKGAIKEDNT